MGLISGVDPTGQVLPVAVDANGAIEIAGTVSASSSAISDGVSSSIKATVKDYANSNPVAVVLVDTSGDAYAGSDATSANQVLEIAELTELSQQSLDFDTGAGTDAQVIFGIALPASGGAVAGGTSTNPLRVDPTGTTAQPVTDNGGSLTVDGTVAVTNAGLTELAAAINGSSQLDVNIAATVAIPVTQSGTWDEVGINDSGNSITVDNPTLSLVGGGVEAAALRVTIASDSTGVLSVDDNGTSLTVDGTVAVSSVGGTVAVTQSGTWDEVGINDSGNSITVDNSTLAVVGGGTEATALRVTVANDSTGVLSVDDNGSSLTVDGTVAVSSVGGTVAVTQSGTWDEVGINDSGNSITVDNSGTFAVQATIASGATSIAKAEDVAFAGGDVGVPAMAIQLATPADTAADGDYTMLQTSAGRLWVDASGKTLTVASHAVTNAGTFAVQVDGSALTSLQLLDDVIFVDDAGFTPATSKVAMVGAEFDDAATDSVDEGDAGALRMSANRNLYTQIRDAAGNERGANVNASNQLTVTGPVTNAGTFAVQVDGNALTALQLIDDPVATLGTTTYTETTTKGMIAAGVRRDADTTLVDTTNEAAPFQVDARGCLKVEVFSGETLPVSLASIAVTNAGTFAVQESGAALTALQLIDDPVATLGTTTYTEASTKGFTVAAVRRDADTTLVDTTNEIGPLQMDANGRLKVEAFSGETLPVSLASVPSHAVTNAGTFAVQVDGSALTSLQLLDDTIYTDDAGFTPATSKVVAVGLQADETATDSVDEGDIGAPRMTLDRKQIVTVQPHTAGGLSVLNATSSDGGTALTNTAQAISAAAGQVYGWYIYNPNATAQYVQFYNTAQGSVTVGTTNPLFMLTLPATSAANVNFVQGIAFSNTGFSCAATATAGGNGAPSTALEAVIFYK